ncbi:TIGR03086 family protein [Spongiactinospora rosea]|uniref:TIGR03086 family protein n=1 Tax=Spongiactinospora rosea TaxID=2248750 RepID=A0A366M601_9ACTN|nr:TIGR03086 family metal-binding protein [Spongiactinospora rosea]RBQ20882.1 TIGR03086 family protein [Spongiactinospora rosea]
MREEETRLLSIGELAARTGMSVKLIRHWSDIGVVPPAGRTPSGYRRYSEEAVARLRLARALRDLGMGMAAIRDVVTSQRGLREVATRHADAIEAQIRTLRLQQAVLRSVTDRRTDIEEFTTMTELARLSATERTAIVHDFVARTMGDIDPSAYRDGLLATMPDLPDHPTAEQAAAWIELGGLVRDPALGAAMRRIAQYAATIAPTTTVDDEQAVRTVERVTDLWTRLVREAMVAGIAADSPTAAPVVAEIVAAWLPTQAEGGADGAEARRRLLAQLETVADPRAERYWQLMCIINGMPVRASIKAEGEWLMTALRANPEPGAREAGLAEVLETPAALEPAALLEACARVLDEVGALVAAVTPAQMGDPTPCADWNVRDLLNHLTYENLMWTGLAQGVPRADFDADHLGDDHVGAFRAAAAGTLAAFGRPGMLTERYGPAPGWRLVEQVLIEMLVHGWDLARATGAPTDLAPDVAEAMLPAVRAIYGDLPRTPGGSFAPAQTPLPGATPADRLATYLGRHP